MTRQRTGEGGIRVALLAIHASGWFLDALLVSPGLDIYAPDAKATQGRQMPNPYGLATSVRFQALLICSHWFKWYSDRYGVDAVREVVDTARSDGRAVIGVEGYDAFSLSMPPEGLAMVDMLIKAQGVLRDPADYAVRVGALYDVPAQTARVRRSIHFDARDLAKVRLSIPCFVASDRRVRRAVRQIKRLPLARRAILRAADPALELYIRLLSVRQAAPESVHFAGTLTHVSRLDLVERLSGIERNATNCITHVPDLAFGAPLADRIRGDTIGDADWEDTLFRLAAPDEYQSGPLVSPPAVSRAGRELVTPPAIRAAIERRIAAGGYGCSAKNRARFLADQASHAFVVAPWGYGELTFRHAEGLRSGRAVITPDLSAAITMFPFEPGVNVLYCKPDWSDLEDVIKRHAHDARRIGHVGRRHWDAWTRRPDQILHSGITRHVLEAVGTG